jgi:hypothetical protein
MKRARRYGATEPIAFSRSQASANQAEGQAAILPRPCPRGSCRTGFWRFSAAAGTSRLLLPTPFQVALHAARHRLCTTRCRHGPRGVHRPGWRGRGVRLATKEAPIKPLQVRVVTNRPNQRRKEMNLTRDGAGGANPLNEAPPCLARILAGVICSA